MDIYRRYFKVTTGPLLDEVKAIDAINEAAHEEYDKILKEIGAKPGYWHRDHKLVGIAFENSPDTGLFKKLKGGGWYPRKNCKAGKELAKRIESVKTANPNKALDTVGINGNGAFRIFTSNKAYNATMVVIPENSPVIYVSVPWYDEDPEKLEQYKKDRESGNHRSRNLDAILWEPTPEMDEVKKWEVDRHIDEWNESVKAGKTA